MKMKVLAVEQKYNEIVMEKDRLAKKLEIREKDSYDKNKAF